MELELSFLIKKERKEKKNRSTFTSFFGLIRITVQLFFSQMTHFSFFSFSILFLFVGNIFILSYKNYWKWTEIGIKKYWKCVIEIENTGSGK